MRRIQDRDGSRKEQGAVPLRDSANSKRSKGTVNVDRKVCKIRKSLKVIKDKQTNKKDLTELTGCGGWMRERRTHTHTQFFFPPVLGN